MITKIVEVTNGPNNWGKFLVGTFDDRELSWPSVVGELPGLSLLRQIGYRHDTAMVLVLDLQTREGALFSPHGVAAADLDKHKIWVCPMYEPFLGWLYAFICGRTGWFDDLPALVDLPEAPFSFSGYRRPGPDRQPS